MFQLLQTVMSIREVAKIFMDLFCKSKHDIQLLIHEITGRKLRLLNKCEPDTGPPRLFCIEDKLLKSCSGECFYE